MRHILTLFIILIFTSHSYAGECGHTVFIKDFVKYNDVEFKGYYFHPDHCFSVEIPKGVIGRDNSGPSSHHGFGAILPNENGNDYLLVQGDWGSELDNPHDIAGSLDQIITTRFKWLTEDNAVILKKKVEDTTLSVLQAKHLIVNYKCKESGNVFWQDSIYAIDTGGSIYEITLYASPDTYKESCIIRDKIAKSWKLESKKCEEELQKRLKSNNREDK
jgi:hypothetical protein